jgi:hypothetical protein
MGYIVNLTVILNDIFRRAANRVMENAARRAMDTHVKSRRRDDIHRDIRRFVTGTFRIMSAVPLMPSVSQLSDVPQKDLVLEKIIDLIREYCAPPSGSS